MNWLVLGRFMTSELTLNLVEGSVRCQFSPEAAHNLKESIAVLMGRLKAIAVRNSTKGSVKSAEKPMEYRHTGDVFLEIFCNPNIWPSPFAAKVLITLRDEKIRLTTEAELTQLIEDVNNYLEQAEV